MLFAQLGLVIAALFTGAAVYINVAEQPARLGLAPSALLAEWTPAYHRGTLMQAPLAMLGFVAGAIAWWQTSAPAFGVAALAMGANLPWTLLVIFPTNRKLEATHIEAADAETRALIQRWGRLHAARSAFGVIATVAFLAGLVINI